GKYKNWKKDVLLQLRQTVFVRLPTEIPPAKLNKGSETFFTLPETENGISTWLFDAGGEENMLILGEDEKKTNADWNKWFEKNFPEGTFMYGPRGVITNKWTRKSPPNYVERSHLLLGQTIDQKRLLDVIATVHSFPKGKCNRLI